MNTPPSTLTLIQGSGSQVHTADGRTLIDLELGFGSAFLGHAHPGVTAALQDQAARLLSCGRHGTPMTARVDTLLRALLPPGMRPGGLYSTGMEVAELAMRIAARHTGRTEFAGFSRSMHGKSGMTAGICWGNAPLHASNLHTLPFVADAGEQDILDALSALLQRRPIAAVFVEPVQGTNLAYEASTGFYDAVMATCRAHGSLCVFDETLTGLYRTGPCFFVEHLQAAPDILLFAKSLGNGFPLATLALADAVALPASALPGSTFSANAMAQAAAAATLAAMQDLPMSGLVTQIDAVVRAMAGPLATRGVVLRGRGALWCAQIDDRAQLDHVYASLRDAGVLVSRTERALRLLPAATIDLPLLQSGCQRFMQACAVAVV